MNTARRHMSWAATPLAVALVMVAALLGAAPASANTPITSYGALPSTTQAGGHPDILVHFAVANRLVQGSHSACNCEDAKEATVHLPPGFIGNPGALPQCSIADFAADNCPIDAQVGVVHVEVGEPGYPPFIAPLYNVTPPPGIAGWLGFKIYAFNAPQFTILSARTDGDYGLDATGTSIFHGLAFPVRTFEEDLWGVPADPFHDPLRVDRHHTPGELPAFEGNFCDQNGVESTDDPSTVYQPCSSYFGLPPTASNSPLTPFLQGPTDCDSPLKTSLNVLSYDGGTSEAEAAWPQSTGCDQLSFNPSLYAQPTTTQSDSPSGIDINLTVPQELSPSVPSPSELRGAKVTLPPGFSINANAADGKVACTEVEARFGTRDEGHCPEYSKVGSLTIYSSALPGPLPGFVYLGQPLSGNKYRIFLLADGFATHVKLAGTVRPNPATGQLVVSFEELPQSPLTAFNMHFFGSERGTLATPTKCGTYPVVSSFTPWDSSLPVITSTQYFKIETGPEGQPCPGATRPFAPGFSASSASHNPGAHAPFAVEVRRPDGDQDLTGLTVATPPGFSGTLRGIPYCPQAAINKLSTPLYSGLAELASSACPAASQIGTAVAGVGAGDHPYYAQGKVFLAGPYRGAPLSLVVVVPAVSGPYDLGNVAVRAAVDVDPVTGQVTTVSDPLPQIVEGIPLRMRSLRVDLDRPGFALNPTNCSNLAVEGRIAGDEGAVADRSAHYQVANCATLPFKPQLALKVGSSKRRAYPKLNAVLTARSGEANVARAAVTLPHAELLDQSHIKTICTRVQFAANACPSGSLYGHATAFTPLLDQPLTGPVYLRSSSHKLPDLVAALRGQVNIDLAARIDSVHGSLRTTFTSVPDVPVSKFVLRMFGGGKGLLVNSENLCAHPAKARSVMLGQNGRRWATKPMVQAGCGHRKRHAKRQRHGRRRARHLPEARRVG